jgi:hypothetical protein
MLLLYRGTTMKSHRFASLAAAGLLCAATQASAVTLTFDDLVEGATLSNQYAGLGVVFSPNAFSGANSNSTSQGWATNTGMTVTASDLGVVGLPVLAGGKLLHSFTNYQDEDGDPSILLTFSSPINSFSAIFASISSPADSQLFIFNGATLIGTVAAAACSGPCQQVLSFSAPSITKVAIAPGSYSDWVGIDDVSFTVAVVPEPSTYGLMALGVALLAWRRRVR